MKKDNNYCTIRILVKALVTVIMSVVVAMVSIAVSPCTNIDVTDVYAATVFDDCYGSQLSGEAALLYSEMKTKYYTNKETGQVTYSLSTKITFSGTISGGELAEDEEYNNAIDKVKDIVLPAVDAFTKDYPSVFWIGNFNYSWSMQILGTNVSIESITLTPESFYDGAIDDISAFDTAVTSAVTYIEQSRTSNSNYMTALAIHDYICNKLTYSDSAVVNDGTVAYYKAHSAIPAFNGDGLSVCEGYAKAFKILCDRFNIPCVLVVGTGVTSTGSENHMWNYVMMDDGLWYGVDVTWDDQSDIIYKYFSAGTESSGINGTFGTEHIERADFNGWGYDFVYPLIQNSEYIPTVCSLNGHTVTTHATCITDGCCDVCGRVAESATGHNYIKVVTKPTCTSKGYTTYSCDKCGYTFIADEISALSHSAGKWKVTKKATVFSTGLKNKYCTYCGKEMQSAEIAKISTVTIGKLKYKITKCSKTKGQVSVIGVKSKKYTKILIPKTVDIEGYTFKVTSISKNALINCKKLKKVVIGNNIKTIGTSAFKGCSKLKTVIIGTSVNSIKGNAFLKCGNLKNIKILSTKLRSVGKNALKGTSTKLKVKVPKSKYKKYKKILIKKGNDKITIK
ncbi:MAG: leucine-rich repeat protein [Eubacterium sp.]